MNKLIVIDYGRLKLITLKLSVFSAPFIAILSYYMFGIQCSAISKQAAIMIFYIYMFTLILTSFVHFILYFHEFRTDKLVLSILNILYIIYYLIQVSIFYKIISILYYVRERCDEIHNLDYIGAFLLLAINGYMISIMVEIFLNYKLRKRLRK